MIVNHIGLCVTDVDASARFYEALGFERKLDLDLPDEPADKLIGLAPPIGLKAVYLVNGPVVLELMRFAGHPPAGPNGRTIDELGLTHLSIGVDDLAAAKQSVVDAGGVVDEDTDVGAAVMVRDPDGQLIELLLKDFRPVVPGETG